ncbi:SAM-dependent methyltransferase [Goodfellowiella coeruleoviolacea]|uniref:SAM-dependent methyltransferase n=1 Tax=Goodfellowiella coeruleoviolacea TaxID=334858 RepID=UPI0020A42002|nr:methyltransferase domain-containing protein [Goodfellowiella coeruleoviolacea]
MAEVAEVASTAANVASTAGRPAAPVTAEDVGSFYDTVTDLFAASYDGNLHVGYWTEQRESDTLAAATDRMTDELITRLGASPGQRVLDIGCGTGKPALRLARKLDVEVVGISVSHHQVAQANELARQAGLAARTHFEHADATALSYPDESFDAAWMVESLSHITDRRRALAEVARVLRRRGRLVIADGMLVSALDQSRAALIAELCASMQLNSPGNAEEYQELLAAAGLELVDISDITEHTRYSYTRLAQAMRQERDVYVRHLGEDEFERATSALERADTLAELRYVLVTAYRI